MYDVDAYGDMVKDRLRMRAYEAALKATVGPGSVVVDIGTGPGILALIACRCGARRVYAIEPDPVIGLARELAAANGFGDRIRFIQSLSRDVELPERADVIVSDLRGALPLFRSHLVAIADARTRFLAAGGSLVPQSDTLFMAVAEMPAQREAVSAPWLRNSLGLDMRAGHALAANRWVRVDELRAEHLLGPPSAGGTIDYRAITSPEFTCEVGLEVARESQADGLAAWFETSLADGIGFSTAPGSGVEAYGQGFFRWPEPVALKRGDTVVVRLRAVLVEEDYVWSWETEIAGRKRFAQSTFLGAALSAEALRKAAAGHAAELTADGEIDRFILGSMDGRTSSGDIARRLSERFPDRFPALQDALRRVATIASRYGG